MNVAPMSLSFFLEAVQYGQDAFENTTGQFSLALIREIAIRRYLCIQHTNTVFTDNLQNFRLCG